MQPTKYDLLSCSYPELEQAIIECGEKTFRANQLFGFFHRQHTRDFGLMTSFSRGLQEKLRERDQGTGLSIDHIKTSSDGTRKYRLKTVDGQFIESVFIPNASRPGRNSICISSQVGCAMGCTFCATSKIGLKRNLSAAEIIGQIYMVLSDLKATGWVNSAIDHDPSESARIIHNIVYMGMGEPLHNYDNVVKSIHLLCDQRGQGYSPRRITVSTSGLVNRIASLLADTEVHIAISLNATNNKTRSMIMPVNKKWPIEELLGTCKNLPLAPRRRITFEYVLLGGINDSPQEAHELVSLVAGIKCKVNLIPFNAHPLSPFVKPKSKDVEIFKEILHDNYVAVFVRGTRGDDINAACGMLGAEKLDLAISNLTKSQEI